MFPTNHKTVFVLDHTPYFGISCETTIELDFIKSRAAPYIPINPALSKSLWTCSIESAVEYCRIVWDLFPQGKLVKFVVSDNTAHILNSWNQSQQNINHVMNGMALVGIPPLPPSRPNPSSTVPEYTVLHGLRTAIEALSECTEAQEEARAATTPRSNGSVAKLQNKCRVVCITSTRDNESMERLEEIFLNVMEQQNATAAANADNCLLIDFCHLVIINTFPMNIESQVSNHPPKVLSPMLTTEVHSIRASAIPGQLSSLILDHYCLASTTVTGIPMKEEQNASSSANYDVEIYHESGAHTAILKGNAADSAAIRTVKEGLEYKTVTLKWCTPRGCSAGELQNCTSMYRLTPVDVNSRPSLCLINFLLNGRSVMLEMPRKSGGKITSHLLASHGGEIFIHSLSTARSVLEDPPSISEGGGGRVTDYRITDFAAFIKQNQLVSIKFPNYPLEPMINKMKQRLHRHTKYYPLTISSTFIFNLKGYIEPLPTLITKEVITDDEVQQCKKVIFNLIAMEAKHEPPPSIGQRTKGQKREDQYRFMWTELETLLKNNLHTEMHRQVYGCLLEVHKFTPSVAGDAADVKDKVELDQALRELEHKDSESRPSVIRATTDSPMSPPPVANVSLSVTRGALAAGRQGGIYSAPPTPVAPKSFFDMFVASNSINASKQASRPDFFGRTGTNGSTYKLYQNTKVTTAADGPGTGAAKTSTLNSGGGSGGGKPERHFEHVEV